MKILAFTDLHGDRDKLEALKEKAKEADVVVSAGDMTVFEDSLDDIIRELDAIGKPVVVIHGNHEFDERMEEACKDRKNVKFIHKSHHKLQELLFLGYGGGGFRFEYKDFDEVGEKFKELIKDHKVIFIVHGPPYNTELDRLVDDHVGNLTIREWIEKNEPEIVVCGHLHENFGQHDVLGESYIVNPGPDGKILEV